MHTVYTMLSGIKLEKAPLSEKHFKVIVLECSNQNNVFQGSEFSLSKLIINIFERILPYYILLHLMFLIIQIFKQYLEIIIN